MIDVASLLALTRRVGAIVVATTVLAAAPAWAQEEAVPQQRQLPRDLSAYPGLDQIQLQYDSVRIDGTVFRLSGDVDLVDSEHGIRLLAAPLSYTETGEFAEPVSFAGADYAATTATEATYRFNSWRVGYRYRLTASDRWRVWIGLTIKVRDARIELRQGEVTSFDSDVGIVPLLHVAADYRAGDRWHILFDLDGLAGGPGRAFDGSLKVGYDLGDRWQLRAGYRLLEGGVDIDEVYNFAWFDYGVVSAAYRF